MKLRLDATPKELAEKSEQLVQSVSTLLRPVSPELADALEKALPRKEAELKFPVLRDLQKKTEVLYDKQMDLMLKDIGKVLDKSLSAKAVKKSLPSPDYSQKIVAKEEKAYGRIKADLIARGYVEADFDKGGSLYGYSTNELIDLARNKSIYGLVANRDKRPGRGGWAPGSYACKCIRCEKKFVGDKRAVVCSNCAYKDTNETSIQNNQ